MSVFQLPWNKSRLYNQVFAKICYWVELLFRRWNKHVRQFAAAKSNATLWAYDTLQGMLPNCTISLISLSVTYAVSWMLRPGYCTLAMDSIMIQRQVDS